jgi:hypothetical protein
MSEQEKMDHLLRQMMAGEPQPALSSSFDRRLERRLRPARLNSTGRLLMAVYAVLALTVSIWVMRSQGIGWSTTAIAIVASVILGTGLQHRRRTPGSRRGHALQGR